MPWLVIAGILIGFANSGYLEVFGSTVLFIPVWFAYLNITKNHVWLQLSVTTSQAIEAHGWNRKYALFRVYLGEAYVVLTTSLPMALISHLIKSIVT